MTADTICLLVLMCGGLAPALAICSAGEPGNRLVGLDLLSVVTVFILLLFAGTPGGHSYDLILPLVLALLSFAGTLVFTRLLSGRGGEPL